LYSVGSILFARFPRLRSWPVGPIGHRARNQSLLARPSPSSPPGAALVRCVFRKLVGLPPSAVGGESGGAKRLSQLGRSSPTQIPPKILESPPKQHPEKGVKRPRSGADGGAAAGRRGARAAHALQHPEAGVQLLGRRLRYLLLHQGDDWRPSPPP
jgi:hypothetical protein